MNNTISNNKRIAKNTFFLYIRMFITTLFSLYTTRAVINILGIENYGIYTVVAGIVSLISLLNSALSNATIRFLSYSKGLQDTNEVKRTFSACLSIHIALALLIITIGIAIGPWYIRNYLVLPPENIESAVIVFYFSISYCFLNITQIPYNSLIIANERMNIYAYISIVEAVLKLLVVYMLLFFADENKLVMYAALIFVVQVTLLLINRIYCIKRIKESNYTFFWDKIIYMPIIKFAVIDIYGNVCSTSWYQGLTLILNAFFGPVVNAAYGISQQVAFTLNRFVDSYMTAVKPQITKYYSQKNYKEMIKLMNNSSKLSLLLISMIAMPFLIDGDIILKLWLDNVPEYCVLFTKLMMLWLFAFALLVPINLSIHATGNIKMISFITGSLHLLAIPILYFMLKRLMTPYIAVLISVAIQVISVFINIFILKVQINEVNIKQYITNVIIPCLIIIIFNILVTKSLQYFISTDFLRLFVNIIYSIISTSYLSYKFILDEETKILIKNRLIKIIH